ncbi:protein of unknown function [Pararobbsia alpina]
MAGQFGARRHSTCLTSHRSASAAPGLAVIVLDHRESGARRPWTGLLRYTRSVPDTARCAIENSF